MRQYTRRGFVKATLACAAFAAMPSIARASLGRPSRSLHLYNAHTGESLRTVYWEHGAYISESLRDITYLLRDYRTGQTHKIDPRLLDLLAGIHSWLGSRKPYEVVSGYRSPKTNAMLREHTRGVAVNSMHMYGKAIDIRLTDKPLKDVHAVALGMRQGGVGYYPESNFIHVDTGPLRQW